MHILVWILFGLAVGVVAKLLMPGHDPGGFVITVLLGIAGAFFGGVIGRGSDGTGMEIPWDSSWPCSAPSSCWRSIA